MIASFSRALINELKKSMSDSEFDKTLEQSIDEIYNASVKKA
jgi:fructose-bisphosphate aldolase class I